MSVAEYIAPGRCACCGEAPRAYWTPQRIVDAIQAHHEANGRLPMSTEWANGTPDHPTTMYVCKVFGRWNNAIRAAGFKPFKPGQRPWGREAIAEAMLDELLRTGHWPTSTRWAQAPPPGEPRRPTYTSVVREFGSWNAAKKYAGWDGLHPRIGVALAKSDCCRGCGGEFDNYTTGCRSCAKRRDNRLRRAKRATRLPASQASARAGVPSLAPGGTPPSTEAARVAA